MTCFSLLKILLSNVNNKVHFGLTNEEWQYYRSSGNFYLMQLNRISKFRQLNEIFYSTLNDEAKLHAYRTKLKELDVLDKNDLPEEYPFVSKRIFYFSKAQIAKLSEESKEYVFFFKKIVDLYFFKNIPIQKKFSSFLLDSINFLGSLLETKNFDVFFKEHSKITGLIDEVKKSVHCSDDSLFYIIEYLFIQTAYNYSKHFEKSVQFANDYEIFLKKNEKKLASKFTARYTVGIASAYLYNKEYDKAITKIEPALNSKDYYSQYIGRILYIVSHYTLRNSFLLDSLFESFFYYLKTVDKKDQITNIRKLKKHVANKTVHLLKNEDFKDFVYIHWDLFKLD